jgi:alpha-galactosidase
VAHARAPLIAGNDLRKMSRETRDTLANREVISIDQDLLGVEGFQYSAKDGVEVWFKPLSDGDWAMAVLNRGKASRKVSFDWKNEQVADSLSGRDAGFDKTTYGLRDLWAKRDAGDTRSPLSVDVSTHDVLLFRLRKM